MQIIREYNVNVNDDDAENKSFSNNVESIFLSTKNFANKNDVILKVIEDQRIVQRPAS